MLLLRAARSGALAVAVPKRHPPSFYGEHRHLAPTSKEQNCSHKSVISFEPTKNILTPTSKEQNHSHELAFEPNWNILTSSRKWLQHVLASRTKITQELQPRPSHRSLGRAPHSWMYPYDCLLSFPYLMYLFTWRVYSSKTNSVKETYFTKTSLACREQ